MTEEELDAALEPLRKLLDRRETLLFNRKFTYTTKSDKQMEVHVMANIDLENLKQKLTEAAESLANAAAALAKDVAGKTQDAAKTVAGKTQTTAKKVKLNAEIAGERNALKDKYQELGKLYHEKYAGNTDPDFAAAVAEIDASLAKIASWQGEMEALEAEPEVEVEAEPEAEPDHIVDEVEETVEAAADQAAAAAEEAAQEAAEVYEQTVDTVNRPPEV